MRTEKMSDRLSPCYAVDCVWIEGTYCRQPFQFEVPTMAVVTCKYFKTLKRKGYNKNKKEVK